jgi:putative SOS response-associated peptidase YedK
VTCEIGVLNGPLVWFCLRRPDVPRYNCHPGQFTPVLYTNKDGVRTVRMMQWGLQPSFAKPDAKYDPWKVFNARRERLLESPVHRRLVDSKRCVVLLEGFYEWNGPSKGGKQPFYIHGDGVMLAAGLFDTWTSADGEKHYTYTILTTDSCKMLEWLHDRQPVFLTSEQAELWLATDRLKLCDVLKADSRLLAPAAPAGLAWHAVDKKMTNTAYNDPDASDPGPPEAAKPKTVDIASFFGRAPPATSKQPAPTLSHSKTFTSNCDVKPDVPSIRPDGAPGQVDGVDDGNRPPPVPSARTRGAVKREHISSPSTDVISVDSGSSSEDGRQKKARVTKTPRF